MAQAGNNTGAGGPRNVARATRKPKPTVVKAPAGDVASSGADYGTRQAKRGAATKVVKRNTAAVYAQQPVKQRKAILGHATGPTGKVVRSVHEQRRARAEELAHAQAAHDILTASDKAKADTYNAAHPVAKKSSGGLLATADNALSGKLTEGAVHLASEAAGKAAPILAAAAVGPLAAAGDYAVGKATGVGKPAGKLIRNAGKDLVDIPANAIPSLYVPGKQAVSGDVQGAAKSLAQPFIDAAKHPGKSIMEHPVGTALLFRGGEGAISHGAGRVLRAAPSETLRRVGSTERTAKTIPGARVAQERRYSKGVIEKGAQVLGEKRAAKKAVKRGESPQPRMSQKDIQRRVDEEVQAAKIISQQHAGQTQKAAKKAVGKKATAATSLAAQGVTNATHADLHAYLIELEREARTLNGDKLKANEVAQQHIHDALKGHDEAKVAESAAAYAEHRAPLEQQVVDLALVKPNVAEATRLAPVAVRRFGASAEAQRLAKMQTKEARTQAERAAKGAGKAVRKAEQGLQRARANARVSVAQGRRSPALAAAEKAQRQARVDAAQAKDAAGVARGRAEVLSRNVGGGGKGGGYGRDLAAERVKATREAVRAADATVAAERARIRGVAPEPADALRNALAGKETAVAQSAQARATRDTAVGAHRAVKKAPFVSAKGEPLDLQTVRGALSPTASEPVFVSHERAGRQPAVLPTARVSISTKEQRGGAGVREGTIDVRPQALPEQSVRTQGLIDAAKSRNRFVEDFGYRAGKNLERYRTQKIAESAAPGVEAQTGAKWSAFQHQDGDWVLVHKDAKARLAEHEAQAAAPQHPMLRAVGAQWRRNVLAFSPRWLTGNTVEAALRSTISGSGPRSYLTAKRVMREMDPAAREQLQARALGGGQYSVAERLADERMAGEDLGRLARAAQKLRSTHGPKELADAYGGYTQLVFHALNGRIENQFQTAMLGKALRDSPLMADHTVKLSRQAAQDAAKGLQNTNAQVALGREVDRMYGQYMKFSPGLRAQIATYTPFISWTLNAGKFLYVVLPHDHPVLTSLIASANQASEGWRKQKGLVADYFHAAQTPGWLQGSIPGAGGSHLRVSRYTPFGLVTSEGNSPLGSAGGLLLPQFSEIMANLGGKNWQGHSLSASGTPSGARDDVAAVVSFLEGQVPAASQVLNVTGTRTPNMADSTKIKPGVKLRARSQFDPFMYTQSSSATQGGSSGTGVKLVPIKVKPVKVAPVKIRPIKIR